ncbi:MAG: HNH endonuclease [Bacillota bacterium]
MTIVTCPFCKTTIEEADNELEHVIPEGLGSPILNPAVCTHCNKKASDHIDGKYFQNIAIKILKAVTNTHGKKGHSEEFIIGTDRDFNSNIKLIVRKAELALDKEIKEKSAVRLFEKHSYSDFPVLKASLNEDICKCQHARMFLGVLSMCVPNFTNSKTADTLRKIMWDGKRPDLHLPEGIHINSDFMAEVNENYSLEDGNRMYQNRHHIISIKGNKDGYLFSYIDLYNTLRPVLSTVEKKEEWKNIDITIIIDLELKKVIKVKGVNMKTIDKYVNGVTFSP